jgi:hypothetical protein
MGSAFYVPKATSGVEAFRPMAFAAPTRRAWLTILAAHHPAFLLDSFKSITLAGSAPFLGGTQTAKSLIKIKIKMSPTAV